MRVRINGKVESVEAAANIEDLIRQRGLSPERVVVEHNQRIAPKGEWAGIGISEDDNIEIVSFVGGG